MKNYFSRLICFTFAYIIRGLWRHKLTNMAASIKEIMETSNAYSWKIWIKFAANWFYRQILSFKAHLLLCERFPFLEICWKSQTLFKLKNMHVEIINKNNILKTLCRNFARPTGIHYTHCKSPSVCPVCFPNIPSGTGYWFIYIHHESCTFKSVDFYFGQNLKYMPSH